MLARAHGLTSPSEAADLYRAWASTYDRTMVDGLGYIAPGALADLLADDLPAGDTPVLDLGCGTGLVGAALARRGITTIDGLDLSAAMMEQAAHRGIYRAFVTADLLAVLPIHDGAYAAAICNGTFTKGHVDARCLDEIVRVIAPGGRFACAVRHEVWDELGFAAGFDRLVGAGVLEVIAIVEAAHYRTSEHTDGRLCLFRRC